MDIQALPTAYDGCTCLCHRRPGVMHFMPCCGTGSFRHITKKEADTSLQQTIDKIVLKDQLIMGTNPDTLWYDKAIRDFENKHGPSGSAWNISMLLQHLHESYSEANTAQLVDLATDTTPALETAQKALKTAEETFLRYAGLHAEKGTEDGRTKAHANLALAEQMTEALGVIQKNILSQNKEV